MRHRPRPWWRRLSAWFDDGPVDDKPAPRPPRSRDPWRSNSDHVREVNARAARRRTLSNEELVETFNDLLGPGDHR